ncbi:MAG: ankyrin repeat domain-containing protein [Candidatus Paceibacterota bacterium]
MDNNSFSLIPIFERLIGYLNVQDFRELAKTYKHIYNLTNKNVSYKAKLYDYKVKIACNCGDLEVIKWLSKNKNEDTDWVLLMDHNASKGNLEVVQWLHENRKEGCTFWAMDWAAERGHLEVVQWLHENRKEGCTTYAMDWASKYGHLEVVKWLHENRKEGCTTLAMNWAAENGHIKVVQYLKEHNLTGY